MSSEKEKLLDYKLRIEEIRQRLVSPVDFRKISRKDIGSFLRDLEEIVAEVRDLAYKNNSVYFPRSIDQFSTKIEKAIIELQAALHLSEISERNGARTAERVSLIQELYRHLNKCQSYLTEALNDF